MLYMAVVLTIPAVFDPVLAHVDMPLMTVPPHVAVHSDCLRKDDGVDVHVAPVDNLTHFVAANAGVMVPDAKMHIAPIVNNFSILSFPLVCY